jgi:hypothetical protein
MELRHLRYFVAVTAEELRYQATLSDWDRSEAGYGHMHRSRPQTLGYSFADSPAGLAALAVCPKGAEMQISLWNRWWEAPV